MFVSTLLSFLHKSWISVDARDIVLYEINPTLRHVSFFLDTSYEMSCSMAANLQSVMLSVSETPSHELLAAFDGKLTILAVYVNISHLCHHHDVYQGDDGIEEYIKIVLLIMFAICVPVVMVIGIRRWYEGPDDVNRRNSQSDELNRHPDF